MAKQISKYRNKTDERQRKQQHFDREKIFVVKYGKKINQYDEIQAARADTEIYPTLEKYGCMQNAMTVLEDPSKRQELYEDFNEMLNLRDVHDRQRAADNLWESLPLQIRNQFNHDPLEFMQNGEKWFKNFVNKIQTANIEPASTDKQQEANNEPQHQ